MSSAAIAAKPERLRTLLATLAVAAGAALVLAWAFAPATTFTRSTFVGVLALAGLAALSDSLAVPERDFNVSLGGLFTICIALLYGPAVAGSAGVALAVLSASRLNARADRLVFNASNLALAGVAAGFAAELFGAGSDLRVALAVVASQVAALVFFATDYLSLAAAISFDDGVPFREQLAKLARAGVVPVAVTLSVAPLFVIVWQRSPLIALMSMLPLVALASRLRAVELRRVSAQSLALTDDLTGLGNRRRFFIELQERVEAAGRKQASLALCLFDLNDFKRVNDTFGHGAGDELLVRVGGALRHDGEAFRLGGDEFALLLPAANRDAACQVAAAVQARIADLDGFGTTASVGVAEFPADGVNAEQLLRVADADLYCNKAAGRATAASA